VGLVYLLPFFFLCCCCLPCGFFCCWAPAAGAGAGVAAVVEVEVEVEVEVAVGLVDAEAEPCAPRLTDSLAPRPVSPHKQVVLVNRDRARACAVVRARGEGGARHVRGR
jgi:hypothetical protein